MRGLPIEIATADPRVIRPVQLRDRYAHPSQELSRFVDAGVLLHLAHGYYAVVPEQFRGTRWRPSVEAAGLAIAQTDYGRDHVAVMRLSAARLHGAIPRALGEATIAIDRQRPTLDTAVGLIRFVTRAVSRLDVQRVETELATGWVTTPEQTVLDLADHVPGDELRRNELTEVIRHLADRIDWARLGELAVEQRKRPAAVRAARVAGVDSPVRVRRRVSTKGLPEGQKSPDERRRH